MEVGVGNSGKKYYLGTFGRTLMRQDWQSHYKCGALAKRTVNRNIGFVEFRY